jgi:hypothetical protein
MTKTKLNANKRKLAVKVFNRHYANEDNILKTEYYNQKKAFKNIIENAHNTAINIINRNYNIDDVVSLKNHDRKYDLQNVRDDACFYLQSDKGVQITHDLIKLKLNTLINNFHLNCLAELQNMTGVYRGKNLRLLITMTI